VISLNIHVIDKLLKFPSFKEMIAGCEKAIY
jgi:hypothetical protein